MECAGEIWIEEESPVYMHLKSNSNENPSHGATLTEIELTPEEVTDKVYFVF